MHKSATEVIVKSDFNIGERKQSEKIVTSKLLALLDLS